jgi:hypothetical protein
LFAQQVEKNKPVGRITLQALMRLYGIIKIKKAAQRLLPVFRIPKWKLVIAAL